MKTNEDFNIEDLLGRPLWQLSCQEYLALMRYLLAQFGSVSSESTSPRQAIGMTALSKALGCSTSLLYGIRHNTDFEEAVISRIGRKEVYDVETARKIANDYMRRAREERQRGAYGTGA